MGILRYGIVFALLITATVTDLKSRRISNWLCLAGVVVGMGFSIYDEKLFINIVSALLLIILLIFKVGAGDIKLLMAITLITGVKTVLYMFILGNFLLIVWYLVLYIIYKVKKIKGKDTERPSKVYPFAPFLLAAHIIVAITGGYI